MTTRSNPLEHLFVSVLEAAPPSSSYRLAFDAAGVTTVTDVLDMTKDDWKSVTWTGTDEEVGRLSIVAINTILAVKGWFSAQGSNDESVLLSLTRSKLAEWRRVGSPPVATVQTVAPATPVRSGATVFGTSSGSLSAADEFKKGIKREISAFTKFKDRKQWNPWHRAFRATAKAQGLSNILDATYVPTTDNEKGLFELLQAHTFAVFTNILTEPSATGVLRKYSGKSAGVNEGNTQKLYQELVELMEQGMAGRTSRSALEKEIISLCLDHLWTK